MKRKKTVPAEVVPKPVNDAAPVPEKDHPLYDRLFVVGFAVLLFFAMTVQTVPMSLILAAVALALSFGRGGYARFRGRLGIPVLGFLAFLILCGAASLYTSFGAYAYGEYAKLLASGALGLLVGTRTGTERRRTPVRLLCRVRSDRASMYRCRVPGTALSRLCLFYGGAWGCSLSEPGSSDLYGRPV